MARIGSYIGLGLWCAIAATATTSFALFVLLIPFTGVFASFALLVGVPLGLALALPVTLIVLPTAHHLLRGSPLRRRALILLGILGGTCSVLALNVLMRSPMRGAWEPSALSVFLLLPGALAGAWCGVRFSKLLP